LEVLFEFVESRGQSAELFEVSKGAFDAVALAIEGSVEVALDFARRTRRDNGTDAAFGEMAEDRVSIVALVRECGLGRTFAQQSDGLSAVIRLAACEDEAERQAKFIGEQVDLGC
jgi:hypothetical protein